jgi:uncharacterized damage-inducible protein DinB
MATRGLLADLFAYNDWANQYVCRRSEDLSDEQLDAPRPMGFGSLRATLFHLLAAERLWLDRWQGRPWAPLNHDPQGSSVRQIASQLAEVAAERNELMAQEELSNFGREVPYRNTQREAFTHRLDDLLLHVANHGIHHRAQALHFLKHLGRTFPGGLDFVFYKLAYPPVSQELSTTKALRDFGLEVEAGPGHDVRFEPLRIDRYFQYGDWAMERVFTAAATLDDAALDRPFGIGVGPIRKTLQHLHDAERWWYRNWTEGTTSFDQLPDALPLAELKQRWIEQVAKRQAFLAALDERGASRIVVVAPGGPPVRVPVGLSLIQLCGHGTHHRAQLLNMLRHCGAPTPPLDYVVWLRRGQAT